jgi:hypothetical protein
VRHEPPAVPSLLRRPPLPQGRLLAQSHCILAPAPLHVPPHRRALQGMHMLPLLCTRRDHQLVWTVKHSRSSLLLLPAAWLENHLMLFLREDNARTSADWIHESCWSALGRSCRQCVTCRYVFGQLNCFQLAYFKSFHN